MGRAVPVKLIVQVDHRHRGDNEKQFQTIILYPFTLPAYLRNRNCVSI